MRSAPARNVIELVHGPGECLQVDWGKLFDVVDPITKKKKTIWIFVGVLGHCRFEMARVVERLDFTTTIEVLISMFEELGGVPRKVTCDNPKVFVQGPSYFEPFLNPAFERFASHYGFVAEALPPSAPEKKGKVELMMPMKRRLFESFDERTYTLKNAQAHITRKMSIANERKHGTHHLLGIMAKPKSKPSKSEETPTAQTIGGKFARPMSEYKNHLRLVHSQTESERKS